MCQIKISFPSRAGRPPYFAAFPAFPDESAIKIKKSPGIWGAACVNACISPPHSQLTALINSEFYFCTFSLYLRGSEWVARSDFKGAAVLTLGSLIRKQKKKDLDQLFYVVNPKSGGQI